MLVPIFVNGECVYQSPTVLEIKEYCKRELDTLWEETKRLVNPHKAHIDLSNELWHIKNQLLDSFNANSHN
jgi:nicotinate phosphoribosyltransferase